MHGTVALLHVMHPIHDQRGGGVCCQPALMAATGDVINVCYYVVGQLHLRGHAPHATHILTVNHGGADTVDGGGDAQSVP